MHKQGTGSEGGERGKCIAARRQQLRWAMEETNSDAAGSCLTALASITARFTPDLKCLSGLRGWRSTFLLTLSDLAETRGAAGENPTQTLLLGLGCRLMLSCVCVCIHDSLLRCVFGLLLVCVCVCVCCFIPPDDFWAKRGRHCHLSLLPRRLLAGNAIKM